MPSTTPASTPSRLPAGAKTRTRFFVCQQGQRPRSIRLIRPGFDTLGAAQQQRAQLATQPAAAPTAIYQIRFGAVPVLVEGSLARPDKRLVF
jgi:hypothetical protein